MQAILEGPCQFVENAVGHANCVGIATEGGVPLMSMKETFNTQELEDLPPRPLRTACRP